MALPKNGVWGTAVRKFSKFNAFLCISMHFRKLKKTLVLVLSYSSGSGDIWRGTESVMPLVAPPLS